MHSFGLDFLRPYQSYMADQIVDLPCCALWADMGLGKSLSTLTGLTRLYDQLEVNRTLIVAPKLVAENTWPNEIRKWPHTKYLSYSVAVGSESERRAALAKKTDIHVINRENIPWLLNFWGIKKWPYDMLVLDEASSFKNPRYKTPKKLPTRFGALAMLKKRGKLGRVVELTGTPAPNGYLDLWSQIFLLDQGARLGKSFYDFRNNWFISDYEGYTYTPRPGTEAFINKRLADICFSLKSEDYLTLPERIDNIIRVPLTGGIWKKYKDFERKFVLETPNADIVANGAASLTGKLLQLANGAVYDEGKQAHHLHDIKLDVLESIIEEAAGQPVLVAYSFESDVKRIRERFPFAKLVTEEKDVERRWNNGEFRMLLCHPASAGHGLNLQDGGCIAVWFGLNWSLELYQQFNKRLHRSGQKKPVIIHHIIAEGTVDEDVLVALAAKDATQEGIVQAVKASIRRKVQKAQVFVPEWDPILC